VEDSAAMEVAKHTLMSGGLILAVGAIAGLLAQKVWMRLRSSCGCSFSSCSAVRSISA
jgi:hypothetical protein